MPRARRVIVTQPNIIRTRGALLGARAISPIIPRTTRAELSERGRLEGTERFDYYYKGGKLRQNYDY